MMMIDVRCRVTIMLLLLTMTITIAVDALRLLVLLCLIMTIVMMEVLVVVVVVVVLRQLSSRVLASVRVRATVATGGVITTATHAPHHHLLVHANVGSHSRMVGACCCCHGSRAHPRCLVWRLQQTARRLVGYWMGGWSGSLMAARQG